MSQSIHERARALFPDDSRPRFAARRFCMSMQAARLIEFGFEEHINRYAPRELVLLASQLPGTLQVRMLTIAWEHALQANDLATIQVLDGSVSVEEAAHVE